MRRCHCPATLPPPTTAPSQPQLTAARALPQQRLRQCAAAEAGLHVRACADARAQLADALGALDAARAEAERLLADKHRLQVRGSEG
eukprot:141634-Chlamydomonas_euryale.AAC.1